MRVSDRESASEFSSTRYAKDGIGAVRTAPFVCGMSEIIVNHVAGNIAPVSKTVSYGTVTNIPGESEKCWITRNPGAGQQPSSVTDTSESAAGWYWHFNKKQGYWRVAGDVMPSWTITSISENSDWQTANDPCTLELGVSWRIPTSTEWNNVVTSGSWTNWNGAWNSGLKLHGSGLLVKNGGSILFRGSGGYFWSRSQNKNTLGNGINIFNGGIDLNSFDKAEGFSLRCLSSQQP